VAEKKRKKKWIQGATENAHGQFAAKAKAAGETTRQFAKEKEHAPGTLGKQARLASTLMGMHHGGEKRKKLYTHPRSKG
jgi:hypothetical protein